MPPYFLKRRLRLPKKAANVVTLLKDMGPEKEPPQA
jgi:hypothetical protein